MVAEADPTTPGDWQTVIPGSAQVYLTGATSYRDHLAISSRVDGLDQLVLRSYAGEETRIPFAEASYSAFFHGNPEFAPAAYRVGYSSMVTPTTIYDYHPTSHSLEVLKVQEIPSGYDASRYRTERLEIAARDGTPIPVSVVMRRDRESASESVSACEAERRARVAATRRCRTGDWNSRESSKRAPNIRSAP